MTLNHPTLGDYSNGSFGGEGFFVSFSGDKPETSERRLSIKSLNRGEQFLTFRSEPPESLHQGQVASFGGISLDAIEIAVPWRSESHSGRISLSSPHCGHLYHINDGHRQKDHDGGTSQEVVSCELTLSLDSAGLVFDLVGKLSANAGFGATVDPALFRESYAIRYRMTLDVARYFLSVNTLYLLAEKVQGETSSSEVRA